MTPPQEPKLWHATSIHIERHTVPREASYDFQRELLWSTSLQKRLKPVKDIVWNILWGLFILSILFMLALGAIYNTEEAALLIIGKLHLNTILFFTFIMIAIGSILSHFTSYLWSAAYHVANSFGLIKHQPTAMIDVDVTFEIPVQVKTSWAHDLLQIHWTSSNAIALHGEPLRQEVLDALLPQTSFANGSLEIAPGKVAIDLSVDPDNDQNLCLELRSVRDKTRLYINLNPSDLPHAQRGQPLPKIKRQGINMNPQARADFLEQLALAAQLEGLRLPSRLQQQVTQKPQLATQR